MTWFSISMRASCFLRTLKFKDLLSWGRGPVGLATGVIVLFILWRIVEPLTLDCCSIEAWSRFYGMPVDMLNWAVGDLPRVVRMVVMRSSNILLSLSISL